MGAMIMRLISEHHETMLIIQHLVEEQKTVQKTEEQIMMERMMQVLEGQGGRTCGSRRG